MMNTRRSSRTDKPLNAIENILNSAHVPVYKRLRQSSIRKKSMTPYAKLHLFDFPVEDNENKGKKFKKTQKVRKRARVAVRHNKENAWKSHKNGLKDIFRDLPQNAGFKSKPECVNGGLLDFKGLNAENGSKIPRVLTVQADVHKNGYSPVDEDILSVGSENVDDSLSEDEKTFLGFDEEQCQDKYGNFIKACKNKCAHVGFEQDSYHIDTPPVPRSQAYMTPHPYMTPNPYMTPDPHKTPRQLTPRYSNIPVIEFNNYSGGNEIQPNRSSENINPSDTFNNISYGDNRYFSTPFKNNSFNSSSLSDLSVNDFNVTNCFGFEEPDNLNEEFLVSPIKNEIKRPLTHVKPLNLGTPSRPQLPLFKDIIDQLKHETENLHIKSDKLFVPETELSTAKEANTSCEQLHLNSLSQDFEFNSLSSEIGDDEVKLPDTTSQPSHVYQHKHKPTRRSYERPEYLRQRKDSHYESFEDDENEKQEQLNKTKAKRAPKPAKKKHGPTKKEVDELEKWAQAFNSQCAQVEAFDLCVE